MSFSNSSGVAYWYSPLCAARVALAAGWSPGRELGGLVADELCGGDLTCLDNIGVANELLLQTLTTVGLVAGCVPDAER